MSATRNGSAEAFIVVSIAHQDGIYIVEYAKIRLTKHLDYLHPIV